jgi:hypothetical protein
MKLGSSDFKHHLLTSLGYFEKNKNKISPSIFSCSQTGDHFTKGFSQIWL